MATRPQPPQETAPAVDPTRAGDPDGEVDSDSATGADQQPDAVTVVVDLTEQKGPARRFYANLADL